MAERTTEFLHCLLAHMFIILNNIFAFTRLFVFKMRVFLNSIVVIWLYVFLALIGVTTSSWVGFPVMQASTKPIYATSSYSPLSFSNPVDTAVSTDIILILVTMNHKSTNSDNYMWQKIYVSDGNINPVTVSVSSSNEEQSANFFLLHLPGAILTNDNFYFKYKGKGTISADNQMRRFDMAVFPDTYGMTEHRESLEMTISTSGTTFVTMNTEASVAVSSNEYKVLLLVTANIQTVTSTTAKFTLYRNSAILKPSLLLQKAGSYGNNVHRQVTYAYVDTPGTGTFTYTPMVAKNGGGDGNFIVSEGNRNYRGIIGMVLHSTMLKSASATDQIGISGSSFAKISGLSVKVSVGTTVDQVIIIVNLNLCTVTADAGGEFTIYRGEVNLALNNDNGNTISIMRVKLPYTGECASASMTYLDRPGVIGSYYYHVYGKNIAGSISLSDGNQHRSITAITIPLDTPADSNTKTLFPCTTGCSFTANIAVDGYTELRYITLPGTFTISFEIKVAELPGWKTEIGGYPDFYAFSIVDEEDNIVLALGLNSGQNTKLFYNNEEIASNVARLTSSYTLAYTTFTIDVMHNLVQISSSDDPTWISEITTSSTYDTTGKKFYLKANSLTAGSAIKQILITGKI